MLTPERHREISAQFLEHAEAELESGDPLQASEKAWGAVAHYVKSVAKERGWPDGSHRDISDNARRLMHLTSDPDGYGRMFQAINALHVNFYEEHLHDDDVRRSIADARALISAMETAEASL
jgi:hypothetical protein